MGRHRRCSSGGRQPPPCEGFAWDGMEGGLGPSPASDTVSFGCDFPFLVSTDMWAVRPALPVYCSGDSQQRLLFLQLARSFATFWRVGPRGNAMEEQTVSFRDKTRATGAATPYFDPFAVFFSRVNWPSLGYLRRRLRRSCSPSAQAVRLRSASALQDLYWGVQNRPLSLVVCTPVQRASLCTPNLRCGGHTTRPAQST